MGTVHTVMSYNAGCAKPHSGPTALRDQQEGEAHLGNLQRDVEDRVLGPRLDATAWMRVETRRSGGLKANKRRKTQLGDSGMWGVNKGKVTDRQTFEALQSGETGSGAVGEGSRRRGGTAGRGGAQSRRHWVRDGGKTVSLRGTGCNPGDGVAPTATSVNVST